MTESNDDSGPDYTLSDDLIEEFFGQPMAGMFGGLDSFAGDTAEVTSEEVEISIKLIKSGAALNQFVEYVEENDIDLNDLEGGSLAEYSYEEQQLLIAFSTMGQALQNLSDVFEDDSDNPFKVDDGEDLY